MHGAAGTGCEGEQNLPASLPFVFVILYAVEMAGLASNLSAVCCFLFKSEKSNNRHKNQLLVHMD